MELRIQSSRFASLIHVQNAVILADSWMSLAPVLDVGGKEIEDGVNQIVLTDESHGELSEEINSEEPPNFVLHETISRLVAFDGLELVDNGCSGNVRAKETAEENKEANIDVGEDILGHE